MLTDPELREIEVSATELARTAGKLLLGYFERPLHVTYKAENNRSPVTDADKASDDYLRGEIARRFPEHAVLSEESEDGADRAAAVTWVIDPLDGTTNFLNGLPTFGVLISVLEQGRPVASATFLPSVTNTEGRVVHARAGGGAFDDDVRLSLDEAEEPLRRMSAWPPYFLRMFKFGPQLRRRLGDVRSTGSAGFELAMAARGVFDYATLNNQWIWDAASGVLLVQEAGGIVLSYERAPKRWAPCGACWGREPGEARASGGARAGGRSRVGGERPGVEHVTSGCGVQAFTVRRLRQRISGRLRRG